MFRAECKAGTELGKTVSAIMAKGGLVSDELVNEIVASRISKPDCAGGFLLDGYPRTVPQARVLARSSSGAACPIRSWCTSTWPTMRWWRV